MYAAAMGDGVLLTLDDLPWEIREYIAEPQAGNAAPLIVSRTETQAGKASDIDSDTLVEALNTASGNKSQAARALGISRMSLWRLLKKYGIEE